MKVRDVAIFNGDRYLVPQGIQRIDHRATHGWQLRYGGTKLFSDGSQTGAGAAAALDEATRELMRRIAKLPAPSKLQREPNQNKANDLPVGISGPVVRRRAGAKVRECSFAVSLPRFGQTPQRCSVYIANENTYTTERYQTALAKAMAMREKAEATYRRDATRAKRLDAQMSMLPTVQPVKGRRTAKA